MYSKFVVKPTPYNKIFVGKSPKEGRQFDGNSMLFELSPFNYMYIGESVYTFKTSDVIKKYVSRVGNNDVPYPYAVGTDNTYLMIENVFIPNSVISQAKSDPYEYLYECFSVCVNANKRKEHVRSECRKECKKDERSIRRLNRMRPHKVHGRVW
jgi:hypothetical protein